MTLPSDPSSSAALPFPSEICGQIASHLPPHDLVHLALTCRGFGRIAEGQLYAWLNLSEMSTAGGFSHIHGPPIKDPWAVVHVLRQNKEKAKYVRSLRLLHLPSSWDPQAVSILGAVAETLEILDMGIAPGVWPPTMFDSFISQLDGQSRSFPRLRKIALPTSVPRSSTLNIILRLTPRLESLTLYQSAKPFVHPSVHIEARAIPATLTELNIPGLVSEDVAGVVDLISEMAPTLTRLSIPPLRGSQIVSPGAVCWPRLTEGVRSLKKLEMLEIPQSLPWHWEEGGFHNLRELTLWREFDRCYVPSFQNLQVPPLPQLKTLRFLNYRKTATHSCFCCQHTHYPRPESITGVPVPKSLFSKLLDAPNLHAIEFHTVLPDRKAGYYPESDQDPPTKDVVETIRIKSTRGQRELIWCRALTHVLLVKEGQLMHLASSVDQDWVSVDGKGVNEEDFARWKDLESLESGWMSNVRYFEMGEEAWERVLATTTDNTCEVPCT